MPEFHRLLIENRKAYRLNQSEIARTIGVRVCSVTNWESEQSLPNEDKLQRIAYAYKIDMDVLTESFNEAKYLRERQKDTRAHLKRH